METEKVILYFQSNNFIEAMFKRYGMSSEISITVPKYLELPFYSYKFFEKRINKKDKSEVLHSYLICDRLYNNNSEEIFKKTLASKLIRSKNNYYSKIKETEDELIEEYYLTCYQKNHRYFIHTKKPTYLGIEYVFVLDNNYILPVYLQLQDKKTFNIIDIMNEYQYIIYEKQDILLWLQKYSPNIEIENGQYYLNCCNERGEVSCEKLFDVNNRLKLISCRIL